MNIDLLNQYNSSYRFDLVYEMSKSVLNNNPDHKMAHLNMGNILSTICEHEKAIEHYEKTGQEDYVISTKYYSNRCNLFEIKWRLIARCLTQNPINILCTPKLKQERRINIGYIGTNFDNPNHPISRFMFNILRFHSDRFNVTCYQIGNQFNFPLKINNKTFTETDEIIANVIKDDHLDILIELMNHTSNRIFLLKYRLAPIQISYCAFPGTTGIKEIDYKIMDDISIPKHLETYFTEKILRLPNGFHNYHPTEFQIKKIPHEGIHFCCFNNPLKYTESILITWVYLLSEIKNSKLFLQYHYFESVFLKNKIREKLKSCCIALKLSTEIVNKVYFTGLLQNKENILQMYNFMDVSLDTFPYNGTTITCESLFMNVPVFTRMSKKYPQGRIGASLLKSIDCSECIIESDSMIEYVKRIKKYCDYETLIKLKEKIKYNITKSSLGNSKIFMKDYEELLCSL